MLKSSTSRQEQVLQLMHNVKAVPNDVEALKECMANIFNQLRRTGKFPALKDNQISTREYKALEFAMKAHANQTRRKEPDENEPRPYVHHLVQVWMMGLVSGLSEDGRCAALLHDVAEDLPENHPDWQWQEDVEANIGFGVEHIREQFGKRVANLVDGLSNRWPDSTENRFKLRMQSLLNNPDPEAMMIKLCDRAANTFDYDNAHKLPDKLNVTHDYISLCEPYIQKTELFDLDAFYDCFVKISHYTYERLDIRVQDRATFYSLSYLAEQHDAVIEKHGLTAPEDPNP